MRTEPETWNPIRLQHISKNPILIGFQTTYGYQVPYSYELRNRLGCRWCTGACVWGVKCLCLCGGVQCKRRDICWISNKLSVSDTSISTTLSCDDTTAHTIEQNLTEIWRTVWNEIFCQVSVLGSTHEHTLPFKSLKITTYFFSKDAFKWSKVTVKIFTLLQNIVQNCSFELYIHERISFFN